MENMSDIVGTVNNCIKINIVVYKVIKNNAIFTVRFVSRYVCTTCVCYNFIIIHHHRTHLGKRQTLHGCNYHPR